MALLRAILLIHALKLVPILYDKIEVEDFDERFSVDTKTPLIDAALEILEGNEKEIFIYRIILGYKFKDIAKALDMNIKSAYFQYKKAINKIKEQI